MVCIIMMPGVYIMANSSHSTIYIGASSVLPARVQMHMDGEGSEFTTKYRCTKLAYYEILESVDAAYIREKELKAWSRMKKAALIGSKNPAWRNLTDELQKDFERLF